MINSYVHLLMSVTHFIVNENNVLPISILSISFIFSFVKYFGSVSLFPPNDMKPKERKQQLLFDFNIIIYVITCGALLLYALFRWASLDTSPMPKCNGSLPGLSNDTSVAILGTLLTVVSCGSIIYHKNKILQNVFGFFFIFVFLPVAGVDLFQGTADLYMNDFLIFIGLFFTIYATICYIWDRSKEHFKDQNRNKYRVKDRLTKKRYKIIMRVTK